MITNTLKLLLFFLAVQTLVLCVSGQEKTLEDDCTKKKIASLISSIDSTNPLRLALEYGSRGKGEHQEWMDEMKRLSIRQASFTLHFSIGTNAPKINVIATDYYYGYFDYDNPITEVSRKRLREFGLEDNLSKIAVNKAVKQVNGLISNFRLRYPELASDNKNFCGKIFVNLLDDEILPTLDRPSSIDTDCP